MQIDEMIAVVPHARLFEGDHFTGFLHYEGHEHFHQRILRHRFMMARGEAETNTRFKQPIPYGVVHVAGKGFFTYLRATKQQDYREKRLKGKVAVGLGGHVSLDDCMNGSEDVIQTCLMREVCGEEADIRGEARITPLGFINREDEPVNQVHFGIVYLVQVEDARLRGREGSDSWFVQQQDLGKLLDDPRLEPWSRIMVPVLQTVSPELLR